MIFIGKLIKTSIFQSLPHHYIIYTFLLSSRKNFCSNELLFPGKGNDSESLNNTKIIKFAANVLSLLLKMGIYLSGGKGKVLAYRRQFYMLIKINSVVILVGNNVDNKH